LTKVARLAGQIAPAHYDLDLELNMVDQTTSGREEISFSLSHSSRELVFHAVGLEVSFAQLDGARIATSITEDAGAQTVTFGFAEMIVPGPYRLVVQFVGRISDTMHGLYRSNYNSNDEPKWLASTQFEPVNAREAFVCIDEPVAKATFELTLRVPDNLVALSNTNAANERTEPDGRKRVQFARTPRMSTYLVAFAVGEFEYVEAKSETGVVIRAYATPGQREGLRFAADCAARILDYFNDYFGIPYPLSKLDLVAIPDFAAGAMENWGMITFREAALVLDPTRTSLAHKQRVALVVAHELAHQWFGDLVTMSWWDDLWLNEGFASWIETLALATLWPEWQQWTQFMESDYNRALRLDSLASTHPVMVPVEDPQALDEIFDAISYSKGASLLNMLHDYVGPDAFRKGLHAYLDEHKYGNTTTRDLWQALGDASGKPVEHVMNTWTAQPGFPLVRFDRDRVRQQRFLRSGKAADPAQGVVWPIPVRIATASVPASETLLLDKVQVEDVSVTTKSEWFKPNPGQTAFYRTLYTKSMLQSLMPQLREQRLGAVDRFGIVCDVLATTEAGLTSTDDMFELISAMYRENDYIVWSALSDGIHAIMGIMPGDELREELEAYGLWLAEPNMRRLGWESSPRESSFDSLLRPIVLRQAVQYGNEHARDEALRRFHQFIHGDAVSADTRPVALYAAARFGDAKTFDTMLSAYKAEASPQVRAGILGAMGSFREPVLLSRYLELGLSEAVRPQDKYIVAGTAFGNRYGRELAWEWTKHNWGALVRLYSGGGHMLDRFPHYAGMAFATTDKADEVEEFFASHPHPAITMSVAQALEAVRSKADWYARDRNLIGEFIRTWTKNAV
jgi:puromycin-sensitive aminopeptidase